MAIVTIGRPAYFFVLFVDEDNFPINVVSTSLHLFTFDEDAELVLLDGVGMTPTGEVGKFMYSYLVPEDWNHDSNLYAHMKGVDTNGTVYLTEQHFDLWNADGTPYRKPPPPPPMSHWNTDDGGNGAEGFVTNSELGFATAFVPTSSSMGGPVYSDTWAGTIQNRVTRTTQVVIKPSGFITGVGGDSSFVVDVLVNGNSFFNHVFSTNADGFFASVHNIITLSVMNMTDDNQERKKANLEVVVDFNALASVLGLVGMKISVVTTHITDSVSDGGGMYSHVVDYFYYDSDPQTPELTSVTFRENLRVVRHLSGIAYYDRTSTFLVAVTGIDDLNNASAKSSKNLVVRANNLELPDLEHSPFGVGSEYFTGWTPNENVVGVGYQKDDWELLEPNYRDITEASASAYVSDTWASSDILTSPLKLMLIDTFFPTSTPQYEGFDDEVHRKQSDYTTAWDSVHHLNSGEALVQGGFLQIPYNDWSPYLPLDPLPNPDYTPIGQSASYYRTFEVTDDGTVSHSNMTMSIEGEFVNGLEQDLINGDLQIFIRRKASVNGSMGVGANPLMVHGTAYNNTLFDDGVTNGQIREFVVGSTVSLTFGGYAVREGVYMEIRITNPLVKLDSLLVSFLSG